MGKEKKTTKQGKNRYPFAPWLLFIYLIMLIYITFFAWNYGASLGPLGPGGKNFNLDPFKSIHQIYVYGNWKMITQILIGNILLFVPLGFLFPLTVDHFRKSIVKPVRIMPVVLLGMVMSFLIEVNQFIFTYRVANVDDVILNTVGALLGVLSYRIFRLFGRITYIK
ncbi:VanZ family protein [Evansella tamaricis]|uniref:VanZ family protein n=1 Tax=Evansella tamaricis TaxID=2069301 RepID=UPI001FEAF934|nr:VanZ family protein [Evansella tamaricis]